MTASLYPGLLVGYRAWFFNQEELSLRPMTQNYGGDFAWQPGVNKAQCNRRIEHAVPAEHCTCGLYAYHDIKLVTGHLLRKPVDKFESPVIVGAVLARGGIHIHEKGFRAEEAQVIALVDNPQLDPSCLQALADKYKLQVCETIESASACAKQYGQEAPSDIRPQGTALDSKSGQHSPLSFSQDQTANAKLLLGDSEEAAIISSRLHQNGFTQETIEHFYMGINYWNRVDGCVLMLQAPWIKPEDRDLEPQSEDLFGRVATAEFSGARCYRCGHVWTSQEMETQYIKSMKRASAADEEIKSMLGCDPEPRTPITEWVGCPQCNAGPEEAKFRWAAPMLLQETHHWYRSIRRSPSLISSPGNYPFYNLAAGLRELERSDALYLTSGVIPTWRLWQLGTRAVIAHPRMRQTEQRMEYLERAVAFAREYGKPLVYCSETGYGVNLLRSVFQTDKVTVRKISDVLEQASSQ